MRGAPGVTLEGDGVTHVAEGLLLRGGPPHEQVSRTDVIRVRNLSGALLENVCLCLLCTINPI